jgi:hypothetical protein
MSAVKNAPQVEVSNINPPRPCSVEWFQKELDLACSDKGIAFRIVWAPELNTFRREENGIEIVGKKYKHPLFQAKGYTRGHKIFSDGQQVGYQHLSGLVTGNPNGILIPDLVLEQRAIERFVIEQRLRDDVARKQHYERRYAWINGIRRDLLGEFPKEGIWTWFHQIEKHDSAKHEDTGFCRVCNCCKHFDEQGQMCLGDYKEPDHKDLAFVKASIYESMKTPLLRDPASPPTAQEIEREAQKTRDLMEKVQEKREDEEDREASEIVESLLRIDQAPTFDMGSIKPLITTAK